MKTDGRKKKRITEIAAIAVFALFVFVLTAVNIFAPRKDFSENENRALAPSVNTSLKNIFFGSFDTEFETWFSDHFVARDEWIEIKASVRRDLGAIENNGVYLARDGRLIQQYFSYDEKAVRDNISYLQEFSADNKVKLNVMLVPGASQGESGYLPLGAVNADEAKLIKSIGEQLKDQNFIDLCDTIGTKNDYYFKTDHHWNELGAKAGYEAICSQVLKKEPDEFSLSEVSDDFKGTMDSRSGAFWTKPDKLYRMDPMKSFAAEVTYENGRTSDSLFEDGNLEIKDKYTYYLDGNHAYVHIKTDVNTKKKALIIKDSYSHILIPYLASEYSELEIFDLRYFHDQVSTHLTDRQNTDVYVIYGVETFASDTNLSILW
ncbi:MAG: hypothetical protein IKG55_05920 [Solobacterium sp.]|nr:hypothetical protein [Solobacterium sp.]